MSVQVEKLEKSMVKLTIEVPAEELDKAIDKAYQKMKKNISVPGFRKGKVPRQMVEKLYGAEVFYEDAANELIPDAYEKAVEECEEDITSSPSIDVVQIEKGKPFIFTAECAVKPPVTLGEYKGIEIDKIDVTVSDEEVEAKINEEREKNASEEEVTDRAVADGDVVSLNFEGFVDGVAFEGGKGEDYPLTIGSGQFIPGFEEQLVGAEIGKEVDVTVTFPEDYQADELAGKEAVFKCTVNSIKAKNIPELDDEFASEVSVYETVAEYREGVKKGLEEQKEIDAKNAKEEAVLSKLVDATEIEIPEAMIATQQRQIVDEFAQRMQMQGLSIEQYFQFTGATYESMLDQVKDQAIDRIKTRLILEEVVKAENITVSDEDLEEELKTMAEAYQLELDRVKELLGDKEIEGIKKDLAVRKAAQLIVEQAVEK